MNDPSAKPSNILLLESDPEVSDFATAALSTAHHKVTPWIDLRPESWPDLARFDLVILGRTVSASDGGDLVAALRDRTRQPIIPLIRPSLSPKARGDLSVAIADCRSRIRQHLQQLDMPTGMGVTWGGFNMTLKAEVFEYDGQALALTQAQSEILSTLMRAAGEIIPRARLQKDIFGHKPKTAANIIEVHISRLRTKLVSAKAAATIENVRGHGYVFFWRRPHSLEPLPAPEPFLIINGRPTPF